MDIYIHKEKPYASSVQQFCKHISTKYKQTKKTTTNPHLFNIFCQLIGKTIKHVDQFVSTYPGVVVPNISATTSA